MKTKGIMSLVLAAIISLLMSCSGGGGYGGGSSNNYNTLLYYYFLLIAPVSYNVTLSGTNEVPPVSTTGTGNFTGTFNKTTKVLSFTLTWSNLSSNASGAEFHGPAAVGSTAGVQFDISSLITATTSGSATGTVTLTAAQQTDLMNKLWYINIDTTGNPAGEIRAQLAPPAFKY